MNEPTQTLVYVPQTGPELLFGPAAGTELGVKGTLVTMVVTVAGSTALTIFDNGAGTASGTVIGYISAANAAILGFTTPILLMPFQKGVTASGATTAPGVTLSISE